jgi:FkbH-like protein
MSLSNGDLAHIVEQLNRYLADSVRGKSSVFIADVETIAASLGKQYFLDDSIVFNLHGSVHYDDWHHFEGHRIETVPPISNLYENKTEEFFSAVFRQIEFLFRVSTQLDVVKLVIFDLDNTLWRGLLIEDYQVGVERPTSAGWPLGVWDAINQLRWRGIAVAIVSKNDEDLVRQKWSDAVDPPFIKLEDFIIAKINWRPKSENIGEILQQLSLTAKSAVFVDDNPVERAAVKAAFPDIRVIGANPFETKRTLTWSAETQIAVLSQESRNRESMLKKQIQRESERSSISNDEFLALLETKVEIWRIADINHRAFGRVMELTNKTNQFNTNGSRWNVEQFSSFFKDKGETFAFSARDKYTDYGIVGVVFVNGNNIFQFIMSCRVLGMEVEIAVLDVVCELIRHGTEQDVNASILHTPSNTPCRELYARSGFDLSGDGDRKSYRLDAKKSPKVAKYVQVDYRADESL